MNSCMVFKHNFRIQQVVRIYRAHFLTQLLEGCRLALKGATVSQQSKPAFLNNHAVAKKENNFPIEVVPARWGCFGAYKGLLGSRPTRAIMKSNFLIGRFDPDSNDL